MTNSSSSAREPRGRMFYYYRADENYKKQHILITSRYGDTVETLTKSLTDKHGTDIRVESK